MPPTPVDPVQGMLLIVAVIFLVGIAGELVSKRTGIPDVVWLIAVGAFLGPVSGLLPPEKLLTIAPYFGAITLVVVLFNGGRNLRLADLGRAAPRATLLAVTSFVLAASVVAAASMAAADAGWLPAGWSWLHAILLGAIVGGSSSAVVMPSLEKTRIDPAVRNLVNIESALTDVLCVVGAGMLIEILRSGHADAGGTAITLGAALGIGLGGGFAAGLLALLALRRISQSVYAYPLTLAALMLLYVAVERAGGSAALAILAASVVLGNAPALGEAIGMAQPVSLAQGVASVHDQITFIVKSFFFTLIGALIGPPWPLVLLGVGIGVLCFASRWPAVHLALRGSEHPPPVRRLVWVALPRGMAAGVLATMPFQAGVPLTEPIPAIVFSAVTTTILIFAAGVPLCLRRMPDAAGASASAEPSPG